MDQYLLKNRETSRFNLVSLCILRQINDETVLPIIEKGSVGLRQTGCDSSQARKAVGAMYGSFVGKGKSDALHLIDFLAE